jgi:hypothetical protein
MGADEFHRHLYCTGSVLPGSPIDIRIAGEPASPVNLALGAGILDPPLATPYGELHLLWPPVRSFHLGIIPASGVRITTATVPSPWQAGEQHPIQALVGPFGDPASRLTNPVVLIVE